MIELKISELTVQQHKIDVGTGDLQLSPIQVNQDYLKEWNSNYNDFVCLTRNGEPISQSLYRVGAFGADVKQDYFMLIKYVEAIYDYNFIKKCHPKKSRKELELQRKHLEGRWCIIDKNGIEKKEFGQFESVYIIKNSCIYSIDGNYYNIETGDFYCSPSSSMKSSEFLFLENPYDKDLSKKGVMKINKKDGSWSVFS